MERTYSRAMLREVNLFPPTFLIKPIQGRKMAKEHWSKIILVLSMGLLAALFFVYDLGAYLTLEYMQSRQAAFQEYYISHRFETMGAYLLIYIFSTALSIPGAAVLTLLGGALFGFVMGTALVSFASTIGATLAFWVARFLLKGAIQNKFGDKLAPINEGIKKDGNLYLFTVRLVPIFPFFVVNLVMALTPIRTLPYFFISMVGMLPATMVYVNAGIQLSKINSMQGILSPQLLFSFALLGLFPIIAKKSLEWWRAGNNGVME